MSDPVTNAEVEDVLSSIRRLVSEDKRPIQAKQAVPANDRLVLTPALRVAEVPEDEDVQDVAEAENSHETVEATGDAELYDDPAHDYAADPYNFADDDDLDGDSDEAEVLALADNAVEDDVADDVGLGDVAFEDTDADAEDFAIVQDSAPIEDTAAAGHDSHDAPTAAKNDEPSSSPATLSAKIAALENAIGNISDTWEPDTLGVDEYSGTEAPAMAWEDDIDRDATGAPFDADDEAAQVEMDEAAQPSAFMPREDSQPEPMAAAVPDQSTKDEADQDSFLYGAEDQLLDEEALRDLVSDIVRSELQGALGERITRNVRKLVRREIYRALTAQEME